MHVVFSGANVHDGCVFTDSEGLCYTEPGQFWCDENPGSEDCHFAGHATVLSSWVPVFDVKLKGSGGESAPTQGCACVEDCAYEKKWNKLWCHDYNRGKVRGVAGSPLDSITSIGSRSSQQGECACFCGQGAVWESSL